MPRYIGHLGLVLLVNKPRIEGLATMPNALTPMILCIKHPERQALINIGQSGQNVEQIGFQ